MSHIPTALPAAAATNRSPTEHPAKLPLCRQPRAKSTGASIPNRNPTSGSRIFDDWRNARGTAVSGFIPSSTSLQLTAQELETNHDNDAPLVSGRAGYASGLAVAPRTEDKDHGHVGARPDFHLSKTPTSDNYSSVVYRSAHIPTLPIRPSVATLSALTPPDDTVFDKFGDRFRANIKLDTVMDSPINDPDMAIEQSSSSDETSSDWLSDMTEEDPVLPDDHPFLQHKTEILVCAFRGLRQYITQGNPGGPSDQGRDAIGGQTSSQNGQQGVSSGKRAAQTEGDEHAYGELSSGPSLRKRNKVIARLSPGHQKPLACVFYKHDRVRHADCLRFSLRRIKDVKQHIFRKHRQPQVYCPTCYRTFPPDQRQECDSHIQARSCPSRPRPEWDGVTDEQSALISQKETPGAGDEAQWYSVWDKVFPGLPRPSTPYVENDFSAEMIHEYWASSGPEIISRVLSSQHLLNWTVPNEERSLATLQLQLQPLIFNEITAGIYRAAASRLEPQSNTDLSPALTTTMSFSSGAIGTISDPSPTTEGYEEPRPMFHDWQPTTGGQAHDQAHPISGHTTNNQDELEHEADRFLAFSQGIYNSNEEQEI